MLVEHISNIKINERQRKSFRKEGIDILADSIERLGLLHPIVLSGQGDEKILIAGERRFEAMKKLHEENRNFVCGMVPIAQGMVPFVPAGNYNAIEAQEAEFEENVLREDLSWQDRTAALNNLHELRKLMYPGQTKLATAKEIARHSGQSIDTLQDKISRATIIAPHLSDPEVKAARDEREAFAIVSKKIKATFTAQIREHYELEEILSKHRLVLGDFKVELVEIRDVFRCIIADPPYEMGAEKFGDAARLRHTYSDTLDVAIEVITEGFVVADKYCHLFLFCDIENFVILREHAKAVGWKTQRTPLTWFKGSTGYAPEGYLSFRRTTEWILYARKGDLPLQGLFNDLIDVPNLKNKVLAAEKPAALYEKLLSYSCLIGDKVLDPCCGSGPIFAAAEALSLEATGIEVDAETWEIANERLRRIAEKESSS